MSVPTPRFLLLPRQPSQTTVTEEEGGSTDDDDELALLRPKHFSAPEGSEALHSLVGAAAHLSQPGGDAGLPSFLFSPEEALPDPEESGEIRGSQLQVPSVGMSSSEVQL